MFKLLQALTPKNALLAFFAQILLLSAIFVMSFATQAQEKDIDSYKLGAGDVIKITVYGESELSMEVLITNSGKIDYPYLGRLEVRNKTTAQLKKTITQGLKGNYLIKPKVAVSIIQYRQIFVNGEVEKPGGYPYQPGLTTEKAIALAGGFTDRAAKAKIVIIPSDGGKDIKNVALKRAINPGDIIVVKASFF